MFLRSSFPPQRAGINRIELIVVVNLIALASLLLIPACQRARVSDARSQSVNNLKQIGVAAQSFHDGNKRLPFNGITPGAALVNTAGVAYHGNAVSHSPTSGSWLFQISPYIDQQVIFGLSGVAGSAEVPVKFLTTGIQTYLCPGRGRPSFEDGKGPWSDYFINNYINDPANADKPDNPDEKRTLIGIKDGTSNTIFAGHGNIARGDYARSKNVAGSSNIFEGGTQGTMRGGPKWVKGRAPLVSIQRDSDAAPVLGAGGWGGPYPQGALMVWCDGTVRMVPYSTQLNVFGAYLTPTGNEDVALPD